MYIVKTMLRRRRDLNPRAAINDLHPFQGCPFSHLGYFSKYLNTNGSNHYFSGEDGIRTHVALPPNGFQDRLVMTASIPLHEYCNYTLKHAALRKRICNNSKYLRLCQHKISVFYLFFSPGLPHINFAYSMSSGVVSFIFS